MSAETNKTLTRRHFEELLNRGDLSVADEIFDANVAYCSPLGAIEGQDRLKRFFLMIRKAMPDLHYVAEDAITEGDRAVHCFSIAVGTPMRR
ncbi:MAG: nuclear transport factor 2 family protein [Acidimicrobiia bacterium]|nr:nuclear transport factor 2 family protein [Acidimicrobiia bacterium]